MRIFQLLAVGLLGVGAPNRIDLARGGIPWVFVNGEPVVANGVMTAARPGRVVRKPRV